MSVAFDQSLIKVVVCKLEGEHNMFFQNFGVWQILLILVVVLILFGVGKLPEVGRGLGKAINEFRSNVKEDKTTESEKNTDTASTESKTEAEQTKK